MGNFSSDGLEERVSGDARRREGRDSSGHILCVELADSPRNFSRDLELALSDRPTGAWATSSWMAARRWPGTPRERTRRKGLPAPPTARCRRRRSSPFGTVNFGEAGVLGPRTRAFGRAARSVGDLVVDGRVHPEDARVARGYPHRRGLAVDDDAGRTLFFFFWRLI